MLIVNADDWGRTVADTEAAREAFLRRKVTSVTAMVFMEDSSRAAALALDLGIPVGLHVNFTEHMSGALTDSLRQEHAAVARYLMRGRKAQLVYNPLLARAFARLFEAQLEEFQRLFGREPSHFDGHQHMHLCANMVFSRTIPVGVKVRRSLSFARGEKSVANRAYRAFVDWWVGLRCLQADYFFDLSQRMSPPQFARVCTLARDHSIELMCHPARRAESDFLGSPEYAAGVSGLRLSDYNEFACAGKVDSISGVGQHSSRGR
jgi:predicted glycoside hydrolase/deacetylase ChbG (UPF0249 family)